MLIIIGINFKNFPIIPGRPTRGINAAIVVTTVARTGFNTSAVPLIAAFKGDAPISLWR